jgi:hypothetical protein
MSMNIFMNIEHKYYSFVIFMNMNISSFNIHVFINIIHIYVSLATDRSQFSY